MWLRWHFAWVSLLIGNLFGLRDTVRWAVSDQNPPFRTSFCGSVGPIPPMLQYADAASQARLADLKAAMSVAPFGQKSLPMYDVTGHDNKGTATVSLGARQSLGFRGLRAGPFPDIDSWGIDGPHQDDGGPGKTATIACLLAPATSPAHPPGEGPDDIRIGPRPSRSGRLAQESVRHILLCTAGAQS